MKVANLRPKAVGKSYAEVWWEDETFVEVKEECAKILGHLDLCLVGRWTLLKPYPFELAEVGKEMCKFWGLKGFLGLTKMG